MTSKQQTSGKTIVIAGAGIAGVSAAEAARKHAPDTEILLVSKEAHLPYYRMNLARYIAGEVALEKLFLHPEEWYRENRIRLMRETEVCKLDFENKTVQLSTGSSECYDVLIIATGSHAFMPPLPGSHHENVNVIRTLDDANKILVTLRKDSRCVCIGGGLLGLETAGALKQRGVEVTVLEGFEWLLPRQLDKTAGDVLERYIATLGIAVQTAAAPKELVGDERVEGVVLEDGTTIPADDVIVATGVRSNSYLAKTAGLTVDRGIIVDNYMRTSHPDVFAAGESSEHQGIVYGTWIPAQQQGIAAGTNAAGTPLEFTGIPPTHALKVLEYRIASIGTINASDGSYRVIRKEDKENFYSFLFQDNRMVGTILMGDTSLSSMAKAMIERSYDCSAILKTDPSASDIIDFMKHYDYS